MTITDIALIGALAIFLVVWWVRATPRRPQVLFVAAAAALLVGAWAVWDFRWQAAVGVAVALTALLTLLASRLRKTHRTDGVPWLTGTVFALLVALAIVPIALFPVAPLPKPSGPDAVGVRDFEVDDASRPGVFAAKPTEPRRLLVRVWYPAGDVKGLKRRPYFTDAEARTTARSVGELFGFPPFAMHEKHVATNSYLDAPLKPGARGLPVVFYSHGYTSYLGQNTVLMEHLASHGYVVFSVQHTYDSTATVFPDGTVAPADPELARISEEQTDPPTAQRKAIAGRTLDERLTGWLDQRDQAQAKGDRLLKSGVVWAQDRIFIHDRLQAGDVPAPIREIAAASDLARVGEMGMSFGGATSGTVCVLDRRCGAGINLDGGDFPFQAFATQMPAPFLMFHSDIRALYRALGVKDLPPAVHSFNELSYEGFDPPPAGAPPVYRVMLKDTAHLGLSDSSLFIRRPVRDPILGAAPSKVMIGAQNDFVLGFFNRHLRGMANGFPERQVAAYADALAPIPPSGVRAWWAAKPEAERAAILARIAKAKGS